jgi:hypothetical protein
LERFDKRDCAYQTRFEYQRSKGFGTVTLQLDARWGEGTSICEN